MTCWEAMIDGTSFGVVAVYLRHPQSSIDYILHVKDRAMLSEVARRIELDSQSGTSRADPFSPAVLALVQDGSVKVSSRHDIDRIAPSAVIDASRVQRTAFTEVIYQPPYYLAHTPGLFEGKVMVTDLPAQSVATRMPMNTLYELELRLKDRDHGHNH